MELRLPTSSYLRVRASVSNPHRHSFSPLRLFATPSASPRPKKSAGLHYPALNIPCVVRKSLFSSQALSDTRVEGADDPDNQVLLAQPEDQEAANVDHPPFFKRVTKFLEASWKFLRPYTVQGSIVASISWTARAFLQNPKGHPLGLSPVQALSALFAMIFSNGFGTGLNQIYDIEIDKINKPYLPIPAGDLSVKAAWALVISMVVGGLAIVVANKAQPLTISLYCFSLFLSYLYSVPPLRWKQSPATAYLIIVIMRGLLVNFGLYNALKHTVKFPFQWNAPMTFITIYATLLALVFGVMKDLPDVEGDRKHGIINPAAILGPRNTSLLVSGVVMTIYVATVGTAILKPRIFRNSIIVIPAHVIFAVYLGFKVWILERADYTMEACVQFYMTLWSLFYLEYAIFPFI